MTTLLVLAVVYLFLANCAHRRRVRRYEALLRETLALAHEALEAQEDESVPEGVVEPPSWTYTMN